MAKKKKSWIVWLTVSIVVFLILAFIFLTGLVIVLADTSSFDLFGGDDIALIRIDGIISGSGQESGLLSNSEGVSPEKFSKDMEKAIENRSVKAIVIRVNSPGGTPAASQELYKEVKEASKEKPVITSISDIGASGAYYAISPSKKIVADPSSLVGSIGVYMEIPVLKGLYEKLGIDYTIVKSGKYKALGHPARDLTTEEKRILQKQVDEIHNQFINDVAKARKNLSKAKVKKLANGLAFIGSEAKKNGLIDKLGSLNDALDEAAKLADLGDDYDVVEIDKGGINWSYLVESLFRFRLPKESVKIR